MTRNLPEQEVLGLIRRIFEQIADYKGEIPGATAVECGNFREHDLAGAKREAREFLPVIRGWQPEDLVYRTE